MKIGSIRDPGPAIVLFYTTHGGSKLRKRIMPLRSLGWLGSEECACALIEAHPLLALVDFDQLVELCYSLLDDEQIEAMQWAREASDAESQADTVEAAEELGRSEPPSVGFSSLSSASSSATQSEADCTDVESQDDELESEAEVHVDVSEPCTPRAATRPRSANVAGLQACLDRALFEQTEEHPSLKAEAGSPTSIINFVPLHSCLSDSLGSSPGTVRSERAELEFTDSVSICRSSFLGRPRREPDARRHISSLRAGAAEAN